MVKLRPIRMVLILVISTLLATACVRGTLASPLPGTIAPEAVLPIFEIATGYRQSTFRWEYEDAEMAARGEGALRTASPDSARLDLFLGSGMGNGAAVLIGDSLRTPGPDMVRRYLPPAPMLWAALGRLALSPVRDTSISVDGAVMRADLGRPVIWRATLRGSRLQRLERITGGRIVETVTRDSAGSLLYEVPAARRKLRLTMTGTKEVSRFDASIWRF